MIGLIMKKSVSKLVDLDIDEVSLVDRSANQHSLVSFSKSLASGVVTNPEESMSADFAVFNDAGEQIDADDLEPGDVVYDETGEQLVIVEADDDEVGKAATDVALRASGAARGKTPSWMSRNRRKLLIGGGTAAGVGAVGGGAYAMNRRGDEVGKSLSASILEDFSKAVTERDREEIIAKAMDEVSKAQEIASEALAYAESEHDARMEEAFISKAAEYNLPVSPEVFGPILKSLAYALEDEELEILDAIFNAVGDALYNEIGYVGESSNSSVLDQVDALAGEYVGKSDLSHAQAVTAMFEANPSAYDAYISEIGR
jgi:hypothetical protein